MFCYSDYLMTMLKLLPFNSSKEVVALQGKLNDLQDKFNDLQDKHRALLQELNELKYVKLISFFLY